LLALDVLDGDADSARCDTGGLVAFVGDVAPDRSVDAELTGADAQVPADVPGDRDVSPALTRSLPIDPVSVRVMKPALRTGSGVRAGSS
jgi:hypothetical protein